ncbi:ATP-dependent chaperone ClpB, partial [Striga asiatica]
MWGLFCTVPSFQLNYERLILRYFLFGSCITVLFASVDFIYDKLNKRLSSQAIILALLRGRQKKIKKMVLAVYVLMFLKIARFMKCTEHWSPQGETVTFRGVRFSYWALLELVRQIFSGSLPSIGTVFDDKHEDFWGRLVGVVSRRPYSMFVIGKIEKASPSITRVLLELLCREDQASDVVDFSNLLILMTLVLWNQFSIIPYIFRMTHDCVLKGSGPERALSEAKPLLGNDLVDKVFYFQEGKGGTALEKALLEHIIPWLTTVDDLKTRYVAEQETCEDDWYFMFKDGIFDKLIANVRMKVESMHWISYTNFKGL